MKALIDQMVERIAKEAEETRREFIAQCIKDKIICKVSSHCIVKRDGWTYAFANNKFIVAVKDPEIDTPASISKSNFRDGLAIAMRMEKHFDRSRVPKTIMMLNDEETINLLADHGKVYNYINGKKESSASGGSSI